MGIGAGGAVLGLQGLAAGTSLAGAYFGAESQKLAMRGAAQIADINARQSELAAQQELARGNAQVAELTSRAGQVKSAQRAALAANGVDLGEGSAAEVLTSTDIQKEQDVNTITANAVRAAWGQRMQATNFRNEALSRRASANSISSGLAAASSLLGSATAIAGTWYSMSKVGATTPQGG